MILKAIEKSENDSSLRRAVLVSVVLPDSDEREALVSLEELKRLLETAGGEFFAKLIQQKKTPDPATYLGSGKVRELRELCRANDVSLVVFDAELSPSQIRNLEKCLNDDNVSDDELEKVDESSGAEESIPEAPDASDALDAPEAPDTDEVGNLHLDEMTPAKEAEEIAPNEAPKTTVRVIDRPMLILDIFALHAASGEGKLQVELAQLKYTIPRLSGRGTELSRLGGGIGTRGPGESKLETDRRHLKRRIAALESELRTLEKNRATMRAKRDRTGVKKIAIAGYTNAGKSTLLNRLTDAGILAEDKLFATLDPTTRRLTLPGGSEALVTDTVGFIRNLPHQLIEAFKSTLEEVAFSDLIVIVCDASDPECSAQLEVTEELIASILEENRPEEKPDSYAEDFGFGSAGSTSAVNSAEICGKPVLYVYNKCDRTADFAPALKETAPENRLFISAKTGEGVDELLERLEELVLAGSRRVTFRIPNAKAGAVSRLYSDATVEEVDYGSEFVTVTAIADERVIGQLREYLE